MVKQYECVKEKRKTNTTVSWPLNRHLYIWSLDSVKAWWMLWLQRWLEFSAAQLHTLTLLIYKMGQELLLPTPHGEGKKTLLDINSRLHKSDLCIYGKPPVLLLKALFWPTWGNTYISPQISSLHIEQRSACLPNCPILHVDTSLLWRKLSLLLQSQTVFSGRVCTVHDQGLCMKWGK